MNPSQHPTLAGYIRALARRTGRGEHGLADAELLNRFVASRDEAAFEVLVWRHGSVVLGVCRRLLAREADAEDAFQATFLALVRKASTIGRPSHSPGGCTALRTGPPSPRGNSPGGTSRSRTRPSTP